MMPAVAGARRQHSRACRVQILFLSSFLPVVLYGCETLSLTLKEVHRGCLRTGF
jgi:hypothetical protein